jgi:hypothetical protein
MPSSAQALYFHLAMRADDDGFLGNPKRIRKDIGAAEDDLKLLIAKGYILPFESGVIVITHWRIHNYLRQDRYKPTIHTEEKEQLVLENNVYRQKGFNEVVVNNATLEFENNDGQPSGNQLDTKWIPSLGKERISKEMLNIEEKIRGKNKSKQFIPPTLLEIQAYIEEAGITGVNAKHFFDHYNDPAINWHDSKNKAIKNWKLTLRTWDRNNKYVFASGTKSKTDEKILKSKERYQGDDECYVGPEIDEDSLYF